jgi:phosphotransferase system  glucose/maltose/N-acetylglucosamine-specific IIC component
MGTLVALGITLTVFVGVLTGRYIQRRRRGQAVLGKHEILCDAVRMWCTIAAITVGFVGFSGLMLLVVHLTTLDLSDESTPILVLLCGTITLYGFIAYLLIKAVKYAPYTDEEKAILQAERAEWRRRFFGRLGGK